MRGGGRCTTTIGLQRTSASRISPHLRWTVATTHAAPNRERCLTRMVRAFCSFTGTSRGDFAASRKTFPSRQAGADCRSGGIWLPACHGSDCCAIAFTEGRGLKHATNVRSYEDGVPHGQAVLHILLDLKAKGYRPDIVVAYPAWGGFQRFAIGFKNNVPLSQYSNSS